MARLGENCYGKARVRVMKVNRLADRHEMKEWNVRVLLQGDFDPSFTAADNSPILPTDTMKNTVYSLARDSKATDPESFAKELVEYFLSNNSQVSCATIDVAEKDWRPLLIDGKPHPTAYTLHSEALQTATIEKYRGAAFTFQSGIDNLVLLKTTNSGFVGFIRDRLTTLPEVTDRILGTRVTASWTYAVEPASFAASRHRVLDTLLRVFADHDSKSVQHTLYDIGETILQAVAEIQQIKLTMPNLHCNLVDLSRFGQDNPNCIFVPTDEPHGYIEATILRD